MEQRRKIPDLFSDGKRFRFNLQSRQKEIVKDSAIKKSEYTTSWRGQSRGANDASTGKYLGNPTRGRQYTKVTSPDGQWTGIYKDWNLILENKKSKEIRKVTENGNEKIHLGTASWVYGEELNQRKAMWWTPDSKKIVYYKFDDTKVEPFFLIRGWSEVNTKIYPEFYPKADRPESDRRTVCLRFGDWSIHTNRCRRLGQ